MLEQRRKLREDSGRLIQEEVEKMEKDLTQEQVSSVPHITSDPSYLVLLTQFAQHTE